MTARNTTAGLPARPLITRNSSHGPLTADLRNISGDLAGKTNFARQHTAVQVTVPGPTSGIECMLEFDAELLPDVIATLLDLQEASTLDTAALITDLPHVTT